MSKRPVPGSDGSSGPTSWRRALRFFRMPLALASTCLVLGGGCGLLQNFWCRDAENRAATLLRFAMKERASSASNINPKIASQLAARDIALGGIRDFKLVGSECELMGVPVGVAFDVLRRDGWYREGFYSDGQSWIDSYEANDQPIRRGPLASTSN